MRRAWWLAVAWMIAAGSLGADWKITTVERSPGAMESVRTEYYKGKLRRIDLEFNGVQRPTTVVDQEGARRTMWDAKRKEYMSISLNYSPRGTALAEGDPATRPVVLFAATTVDTGERQTIFGRTARHLITSEKRSREERPGAEAKLESETITDAWYIDGSGLPAETHAHTYAVLVGSVGQTPVVKTSHTGPVPSGFAVWKRVTWRGSGFPNCVDETTVKELQEGELSSALFQPPNDFRRVDKLPDTNGVYRPTFSDEIEMFWDSFEYWLFRWFS